MQVGDLVKEIVTDEAWRLYSDTVGVVVRPADDDMGLHRLDHEMATTGSLRGAVATSHYREH